MQRSTTAPAILAACLGLAACVGPQNLDQPLSPLVLRNELVDRVIVADENGQAVTLRLARNGIAARNGPDIAEYGSWRTDESGALCLWWHEQAERCAPVHAAGGSHYHWGASELSVLGR